MMHGEPVPEGLTTACGVQLYHMLRRDFEAARIDVRAQTREPWELRFAVMRSLLAAMATRRFGAEPPLGELTAFLATARVPFHPRPISVIDAEAVLRNALGEPEIKRGMGYLAEVHATFHTLVYLADDLKPLGEELADMIRRAERSAVAPFTG